MSKPSDRKSTFSNQEGAHILQSSHFPMPSLSLLQFLVRCLPRSVEPQSQSRPLRTATARVGGQSGGSPDPNGISKQCSTPHSGTAHHDAANERVPQSVPQSPKRLSFSLSPVFLPSRK